MGKATVIALYLPQFHPIPQNDEWWGKGFTEWTNVGKARPLFKGHYQPRVPADLGYYDLRLPEVREEQARMAKECGISAFCYYHYWFGNGQRLLERPFNEVLESGNPDFPFCLCWANHSWSNKTWQKGSTFSTDTMLMEQKYLGVDDYTQHFNALLSAFKDKRYFKIDGKPVFAVYDTLTFPDVELFIKTWRKLAEENGLAGIHFVGMVPATLSVVTNPDGSTTKQIPDLKSSAYLYNKVLSYGFDAVNSLGKSRGEMLSKGVYIDLAKKVFMKLTGGNIANTYEYSEVVRNFFPPEDKWENVYPTVMPQWDRSPRIGKAEGIYVNSTPEKFKEHLQQAVDMIQEKEDEHKVIFLKSWNEWAEGNYVEPDIKYGHGYLNAIKEVLL